MYIKKIWFISNFQKFDRPENAFIYLNPDVSGATSSSDNKSHTGNQKTSSNGNKSIRSRFLSINESKKSNFDKQRNRSTSLGGSETNFDKEINEIKGFNDSDSALLAPTKVKNKIDRAINDSYLQNVNIFQLYVL